MYVSVGKLWRGKRREGVMEHGGREVTPPSYPPQPEYRNNGVVPYTVSCEMSTELETIGLLVS